MKQVVHESDREADDVGVTPLDSRDKLGSKSLDGVSARFVEGLSACNVGADFLLLEALIKAGYWEDRQ